MFNFIGGTHIVLVFTIWSFQIDDRIFEYIFNILIFGIFRYFTIGFCVFGIIANLFINNLGFSHRDYNNPIYVKFSNFSDFVCFLKEMFLLVGAVFITLNNL